MTEYIELIDKYKVVHNEEDYCPAEYRWIDNTGEIVRCVKCNMFDKKNSYCRRWKRHKPDDWFCADGEREVQDDKV